MKRKNSYLFVMFLCLIFLLAGCRTRTKAMGTNVNGICAMIYGCYATCQVFGRCKQF